MQNMLTAALLLTVPPLVMANQYDPIILPSLAGRAGPAKLVVFVPGGKVPPSDYAPFLYKTMSYSSTKLVGAIVHCGKLNLCDPLGQLPGIWTGTPTRLDRLPPLCRANCVLYSRSIQG